MHSQYSKAYLQVFEYPGTDYAIRLMFRETGRHAGDDDNLITLLDSYFYTFAIPQGERLERAQAAVKLVADRFNKLLRALMEHAHHRPENWQEYGMDLQVDENLYFEDFLVVTRSVFYALDGEQPRITLHLEDYAADAREFIEDLMRQIREER